MRAVLLTLAAVCVLPGAAAPQTHLVVVSGLGGEPRYSQAFYDWSRTLVDAARERFALPDSHVVYLAERVERDPQRIRARSTRQNVQRVLGSLAATAAPDARIFIVLIGHGSYQRGESRISLPGPDMTAADFAPLLEAFGARQVVFVNAASASGGFVEPLSGPGRTIITATRSGMERNQTLFGRFFAQAFAGDGADVDKDGHLSALEAFNYARREVARVYEGEDRLLTEHALLDDDGDGAGSTEPDPETGDGALAARMTLASARSTTAAAESDDPELAALYREKRRLEQRIAELRSRKETMDPDRYTDELERLLVELAVTSRTIREREGDG